MFTAGPSTTPTPNARASRPMAAPSRRARSGSKLAATEHPAGKQTALRLWLGSSRSGSWVRRPCGPSETIRVGMPRRSTVLVCQKSAPEQSPAFSSSVSWATSSGMLCSIKKSSSFCPPAAGGGKGRWRLFGQWKRAGYTVPPTLPPGCAKMDTHPHILYHYTPLCTRKDSLFI